MEIKELKAVLDRLVEIQKNLENKALSKDPSIIMDTFELDETIEEMRRLMSK